MIDLALAVLVIGCLAILFFPKRAPKTAAATDRTTASSSSSLSNLRETPSPATTDLDARLIDEGLKPGAVNFQIKEIDVKGRFPLKQKRRIAFVTSVFDNTGGKYEYVISSSPIFREPHNRTYRYTSEVGLREPGSGFDEWTKAGEVDTKFLVTPETGARRLVALLRLIDLDNMPDDLTQFYAPDHPGLIWQRPLVFNSLIKQPGYLESVLLQGEAATICIALAMAFSVSYGVLDARASEKIIQWMNNALDKYPVERRDILKADLDHAYARSHSEMTSKTYNVMEYVNRLNEIADNTLKYEAIKLCTDVTSQDPTIAARQIRIIGLLARALKLDANEIEIIRILKSEH